MLQFEANFFSLWWARNLFCGLELLWNLFQFGVECSCCEGLEICFKLFLGLCVSSCSSITLTFVVIWSCVLCRVFKCVHMCSFCFCDFEKWKEHLLIVCVFLFIVIWKSRKSDLKFCVFACDCFFLGSLPFGKVGRIVPILLFHWMKSAKALCVWLSFCCLLAI